MVENIEKKDAVPLSNIYLTIQSRSQVNKHLKKKYKNIK